VTPAELAHIHAACFATPRPWTSDEFAALLAAHGTFLAALPPHGFALGRTIADEAELLTLAVAPEARRRGLGRTLLADYSATARTRGAAQSILEVSAENLPAQALYTGAGYRITGRRPRYYITPDGRAIDALVMACSLTLRPNSGH